LTTFAPLFVPARLRAAVADEAWLEAMLDAERALATALARLAIIPEGAAAAVVAKCDPKLFDIQELAEQGRSVGNPAEPLVRALRDQVGGENATYVHHGATSQDVVDTAAMLVARRAVGVIDEDIDGLERACSRLASEHRSTPIAARTLLQQAVPTTFGYKAALWLAAVRDAHMALEQLDFPTQLGGAAGTLAPFGERGPEVLAAFAAELRLDEPPTPWHTNREPIVKLASALAAAARAAGKIGLDVILLAQTEVAEVSEEQPGGSSTMPHKRNPVRAVLARACSRGVLGYAAVLTGGEYEHERAAGAWQAEWNALSGALAMTGGAAAAARESLDGLQVDAERMRANMSADVLSEQRSFGGDGSDPASYLGAAEAFVDRVLASRQEAE
jgi:3-carboxy-cis,cis-muconate cycloisomerase